MDDVLEGLLEQFLAGVADDGTIRPVDAEEAAGGVVVDDADGGVLEGAAEPLLAFAQRLLGPFPIADVARKCHCELAPGLAKLLDAHLDGENGPVLAAVPRLERDRLSRVEPPSEVVPVGWRDALVKVRRGHPDQFLPRVSKAATRLTIHVEDHAVLVE